MTKGCVNDCGEEVKAQATRAEDVAFVLKWPLPCTDCNEQLKHVHEAGGEG